MARRLYRWRMRLARMVAPDVIMRDPIPDATVLVVYRKDGVEWALSAQKFRLKSTSRLPSLEPGEYALYNRTRTCTRFVGMAES